MAENSTPKDANVIYSHVSFKVKNDDGILKLKGRFVFHINRDVEKYLIRIDSAAADMKIVRTVVSLAATIGFNLATADIKRKYMQSGLIRREVYVRPPRDCHRRRAFVWELSKVSYGMVDAERQWLLRIPD